MTDQSGPGESAGVVEMARRQYRRLVPERIRNPLGLVRRHAMDRLLRIRSPLPLPSPELLMGVQMTPWVAEYLEVGRRAEASLRAVMESVGFVRDRPLDLLDLGCGVVRVTRHLLEERWRVCGCDVDAEAIAWARDSISGAEFRVNDSSPPLPFRDDQFDVVIAVSLFTHFDADQQVEWFSELGRVVRPDGIALVSTMGPPLLECFPALATPNSVATLTRAGFLFERSGSKFNEGAAFHSAEALGTFAAPFFEVERWMQRGLDDFQDLSLLRRR